MSLFIVTWYWSGLSKAHNDTDVRTRQSYSTCFVWRCHMLCQNQVNDALLLESLPGFHSDTKTWLVMLNSACHVHTSHRLVSVDISSSYMFHLWHVAALVPRTVISSVSFWGICTTPWKKKKRKTLFKQWCYGGIELYCYMLATRRNEHYLWVWQPTNLWRRHPCTLTHKHAHIPYVQYTCQTRARICVCMRYGQTSPLWPSSGIRRLCELWLATDQYELSSAMSSEEAGEIVKT